MILKIAIFEPRCVYTSVKEAVKLILLLKTAHSILHEQGIIASSLQRMNLKAD